MPVSRAGKFIFIFCFLLGRNIAHARTGDPGIQVTFPGLQYTADSSISIPFSRAGNLILIRAKADTTEGNFILDTGCPHLVLNLTYFRDYPLQTATEERGGITGASFTVNQTQIADFSLGGNSHYRISADVLNLGNIENSKGIKVLGLIGLQLLSKFEMIIDYETYRIYLRKASKKEPPGNMHPLLADTSTYHVVPITLTDNRIMVNTLIAGKKIRLIIDSGAETNLLDSRLPDKVFEQVSITGRSTLMGAGNTKIDVLRGDLNSLTLGRQVLEGLPVLITNLEKTCFAYGGCVDGILGFDILSLRRIGFNFVTNKMYIWR